MRNRLILFLLCFVISCCSTKDNSKHNQGNRRSKIILINLGNSSRSAIGKALDRITKHGPKVVAINILFKENKGVADDSVLANSIRQAKNIILATNLHNGKLVESNIAFKKNCMAEGLVSYGYDDDKVTSHQIYISHGDELLWSFPVAVVSYFNPEYAPSIMNKVLGNEYYKIRFDYNLEDFTVINIENLEKMNLSMIKDNIVLMGYLGPSVEDQFAVYENLNEYGTVILANCIENILAGYFEKMDD